MKQIFVLLIGCLITSFAVVSANDGIPDNCENINGEHFQENLFARVADNHDIVLVDWISGTTIRTLPAPTDVENTFIGKWSPNCAYLTGIQFVSTVDNITSYQTLVWDTRTATLLTTFDDAQRIAHPITWSDNSNYLLVEGRNGAFVWQASTNIRVQLSSGADGMHRHFLPIH